MNDKRAYDYDDVHLTLDDRYVEHSCDTFEPDLSFALGELRSELPLVLYHEGDTPNARMEEACAKAGLLTAGAPGSRMPLWRDGELPETVAGDVRIFEAFDPLRADCLTVMRELANRSVGLVVGCSASTRQGLAIANELRLASAVLVGPTQASTAKRVESLGMHVPRVMLVEALSRSSDVPVIATASSSSDVCKALVVGADAALIHMGGPFQPEDDLDFVVNTIARSLRESLVELCLVSGAKNVRELSVRCKLAPR